MSFAVLMDDFVSKLFQLFFLSIVLFFSIGLNAVVTYTLIKCKRLQNAGNLLVMNLTSTNFVSSTLLLPMLIISGSANDWLLGSAVCQISAFLQLLCLQSTNLTLALVAVDRYYAIVKPMAYASYVTKRRMVCVLAFCWTVAIFTSVPPFWGWSEFAYQPHLYVCTVRWNLHPIYTAFVLINYVVVSTIMIACYTFIYMTAKLQHDAVTRSSFKPTERTPICRNKLQVKLMQKLPWLIVTYSSPYKAGKTITLLVGSYQITWAIFIIWIIMDIAGESSGTLAFMAFFTICAAYAIHPVLYGFMNRTIRKQIFHFFCGKSQRRLVTQVPPSSVANTASMASFMDYLPHRLYFGGVDPSEVLHLQHKASKISCNKYSLRSIVFFPRSKMQRQSSRCSRGQRSPNVFHKQACGLRRSSTAPCNIRCSDEANHVESRFTASETTLVVHVSADQQSIYSTTLQMDIDLA